MGAYVIAAYVEGPFMPWIGFVFLMGHMSVNHIYRQFENAPDRVDITGESEPKSHIRVELTMVLDRGPNGFGDEGMTYPLGPFNSLINCLAYGILLERSRWSLAGEGPGRFSERKSSSSTT